MAKAQKKMTPSKKSKKPAAAPQVSKKAEKKSPAKAETKKAAAAHAEVKPASNAAPKAAKGKTPAKAPAKTPKEKEADADDFVDPFDHEVDEEALLADEHEEEEEAAEELSAEADTDDSDDDTDDDDDELLADDTSDEDIILTDAEGNRYCRARDCDQIAVVDAYCRNHYLLFWKKIQVRKKILQDGKLERYVEELTSRYPDKFLEMIRRDLRTEKDFVGAIQELEIDEAGLENEFEEDAQSFVDEIRGMGGGESDTVEDEF